MTTETTLTDTTRSAFESACRQHAEDAGYEGHERLARDGAGYADSHTQAAWWGWCEALQSPEIQALKHNQKLLVEMLEESDSLLVACAHEKRPWKEIQEQLGMNRAAINAAMEQQT